MGSQSELSLLVHLIHKHLTLSNKLCKFRFFLNMFQPERLGMKKSKEMQTDLVLAGLFFLF